MIGIDFGIDSEEEGWGSSYKNGEKEERDETLDSDEEDTEENIHAAFGEIDDDAPEKNAAKGKGDIFGRECNKLYHHPILVFYLQASVIFLRKASFG